MGIDVLQAGEHGLLVQFGGPERVLGFAQAARERWQRSLAEVVPGERTVLLLWNEFLADPGEVAALAASTPAASWDSGQAVEIAVTYDGPDLREAAALASISVEELVARHQRCIYRAAFSGFAPGFAYLRGDDPALALPRRAEPRTEVPAGSVALGGGYCAVYPRTSPGGWLLIGTTAAPLFDGSREPPALIAPGDSVRFKERT